MAAWLVILLFSVGAVLIFVVGLSLTLMIKGHHIDGEISTNRHMRARGITCAVHDEIAHRHESGALGERGCGDVACASCATSCAD